MKVKNLVLGIAIFVVAIIVGVTGISTIYERPEYEDFCPFLTTEESCVEFGGNWVNYEDTVKVPRDGVSGYCDVYSTKCQDKYDESNRDYYKKIFLTALPLGIVFIILGVLVFGLETVGAGLAAGGIGIIIYGIGGFWRYTDNWLRFVISLVGLLILIWLAYWFNKNHTEKSKKVRKKRR